MIQRYAAVPVNSAPTSYKMAGSNDGGTWQSPRTTSASDCSRTGGSFVSTLTGDRRVVVAQQTALRDESVFASGVRSATPMLLPCQGILA